MLSFRSVAWVMTLTISSGSTAYGQDYPNKPIRIVTSEGGGASDIAARLIVPGLTTNMGQQVVVENRPSGVIPGQIVSQALPDGYTLLLYGSGFWIGPLFQDKTPYDPIRDFAPITLATSAPNILVVHPGLPVKSVEDLIALAKAKPGALNYASAAPGSTLQLSGELFKAMAGVNIVGIPYKGTAQGLTDLIAGQVHVMFPNAGAAMPHVKSGRLRALAVASAKPSALAPGLPTVASTGLPGYESTTSVGLFAPAKTPAIRINRLNVEIVRALNGPEVKEKFFNSGVEVVGSSPEQFAATVKSDMVKLGKVIKDAGIRAE